jgi:RNA ligase (TIGR02306 family)
MTRKLATIRRITSLMPIPGADKIELAAVDGWNVVVQKGLYNVDDLAVYFEIDSFIPNALAPFLTKEGHYPKVYEGVQGERLKTVRLRKQRSQGLLMPLSEITATLQFASYQDGVEVDLTEGTDLTDLLGILKWEPTISAQLAGQVKGNFPSLVPKTDQERIQNLARELGKWKGNTWTVTEKLEGSSCTMYLSTEGDFEVCSRNLSLKFSESNTFWGQAIRYDVEAKMRERGMCGVAIQGELVGPGIQDNIYGLSHHDFYVFHIYDVKEGKKLRLGTREVICEMLGLKHVPVLKYAETVGAEDTVADILEYAEGKSQLNPKQEREGVVFECNVDTNISWKAISNKYLEGQK